MRIAVWHNLPNGGAKRVLHGHVAGLVARGHHVESWCPDAADSTYLPLGELIKEHVRPLSGWPRSPKRPGEGLRRFFGAPDAQAAGMIAHSKQCAEEIRRGGFDVVFANTCQHYASPFIGRYVPSPKLLYLQEPSRYIFEAMPELPWMGMPDDGTPRWHPRALRRQQADMLRNLFLRERAREELTNAAAFDTVLVNSYYSRESLLRIYGIDPRVCYLGVDTALFRPQDRERRRQIVGLSAFHRTKGVETAVEAVGCLPEPRPPLLWIANSASDAYIAEMRELARARRVDLEIHRLLPDDEVVRLLNEAAVMLYTARLEPFGLAPLEANACATPVVAVAEGGARETIRDGFNGLLEDRDPARLARALARLLDHPAEAREMGRRGAAHVVESWGVARSVDRLEAELRRCVDTHCAR